MPIEIIEKNFGNTFFDLLHETRNELLIISPFISYETANRVANWLEEVEEDISCKVITRFNREEFIQGANSIRGLLRLHQTGARIFALQHLHTKLYLFDSHSVLLGSANFTLSGFFKNHELGLFMKNEPVFAGQCLDYFQNMLSQIQHNGEWELTIERLEKESTDVQKQVENRKGKMDKQYNFLRWGAVLDPEENQKLIKHLEETKDPILDKDFLEPALKEANGQTDDHTGYRIKFEGTSASRIPNDKVYLERKRGLHEHLNRTYYPRPPRSIRPGEMIFIAAVSEKDGRGTPIIVGYATVPDGFREENVISESDYNFKKWNNRFPYYIEYAEAKFLKAEIREGISLFELCEALRHDVYPGTQKDTSIPVSKINTRHHEKAHIQITKKAAEYLKRKLDRLFSIHGYDEVK